MLSPQYNFLMLHITKCAGTSVKQSLTEAHGHSSVQDDNVKHDGIGNSIPPGLRPYNIDVHDPLFQIEQKIKNHYHLDDLFKFTFVRNPWARIFSFYQHKVRRRDADSLQSNGEPKEFNQFLATSNNLLLQAQTWWMVDQNGDEQIDFIGKTENLEQDFNTICQKIGFNNPPGVKLLNTSTDSKNYKQAYNLRSKLLIEHYYKAEIERFGYTFD